MYFVWETSVRARCILILAMPCHAHHTTHCNTLFLSNAYKNGEKRHKLDEDRQCSRFLIYSISVFIWNGWALIAGIWLLLWRFNFWQTISQWHFHPFAFFHSFNSLFYCSHFIVVAFGSGCVSYALLMCALIDRARCIFAREKKKQICNPNRIEPNDDDKMKARAVDSNKEREWKLKKE